jgi:glyoxylate carboligase
LAEKLAEWGVSVVFGLPGDKNAHIMDALRQRQDKIQFVLVRHEEGAAFMAGGLLGTRFTQGVNTISLYDDVTSGVYNELITGPYHLLSVADMARRASRGGASQFSHRRSSEAACR